MSIQIENPAGQGGASKLVQIAGLNDRYFTPDLAEVQLTNDERAIIEALIEALIELVDAVDGNPDLEADDHGEDDDPLEDADPWENGDEDCCAAHDDAGTWRGW